MREITIHFGHKEFKGKIGPGSEENGSKMGINITKDTYKGKEVACEIAFKPNEDHSSVAQDLFIEVFNVTFTDLIEELLSDTRIKDELADKTDSSEDSSGDDKYFLYKMIVKYYATSFGINIETSEGLSKDDCELQLREIFRNFLDTDVSNPNFREAHYSNFFKVKGSSNTPNQDFINTLSDKYAVVSVNGKFYAFHHDTNATATNPILENIIDTAGDGHIEIIFYTNHQINSEAFMLAELNTSASRGLSIDTEKEGRLKVHTTNIKEYKLNSTTDDTAHDTAHDTSSLPYGGAGASAATPTTPTTPTALTPHLTSPDSGGDDVAAATPDDATPPQAADGHTPPVPSLSPAADSHTPPADASAATNLPDPSLKPDATVDRSTDTEPTEVKAARTLLELFEGRSDENTELLAKQLAKQIEEAVKTIESYEASISSTHAKPGHSSVAAPAPEPTNTQLEALMQEQKRLKDEISTLEAELEAKKIERSDHVKQERSRIIDAAARAGVTDVEFEEDDYTPTGMKEMREAIDPLKDLSATLHDILNPSHTHGQSAVKIKHSKLKEVTEENVVISVSASSLLSMVLKFQEPLKQAAYFIQNFDYTAREGGVTDDNAALLEHVDAVKYTNAKIGHIQKEIAGRTQRCEELSKKIALQTADFEPAALAAQGGCAASQGTRNCDDDVRTAALDSSSEPVSWFRSKFPTWLGGKPAPAATDPAAAQALSAQDRTLLPPRNRSGSGSSLSSV